MRRVGWNEAFIPFGMAVSAALHGSVLGVVLLGWPLLTILVNDDWFNPDEFVRVDVVLYSEKEEPEVAKGKGIVSFDTETIGKGQAQSSGRAFGPLASHSRIPLVKPNPVAKRKSAPDAPSKASETSKNEAQTDTRRETAENSPATAAQSRRVETVKTGVMAAESAAKDSKAENASASAAGQRQSGQNDASGTDSDAGLKGVNPSRTPPSERADATIRPTPPGTPGQALNGEQTARAQVAQSEALSPDRPKGREDATAGALAEGTGHASAVPNAPDPPDPTDLSERSRDGAETGHAEATAETGEAESDTDDVAATGSRTAKAVSESESASADAKIPEKEPLPEPISERAAEAPTAKPVSDTRQTTAETAKQNKAETRAERTDSKPDRPDTQISTAAPSEPVIEPAEPPKMRLIRFAAALDLSSSSNPTIGAPDAVIPLALSSAGEVFALRPGARAAEAKAETEKPADLQENLTRPATPVDSERAVGDARTKSGRTTPPSSASQLAQSGPSPIRNLPLRMLVQAMPGIDETLVEAIDQPESVPEQPATARRKKTIDRIAAAAERGYVHAQYGMARRYLMGQGVPRDPAAGAEWLQQAAEQGHVPSQLLLGYLAARGYGRDRSMADAMTWWTLAADAGDSNAASAVEITEPSLDPRDLLEARRNVNSWRAAFGEVDESDSVGGDNTPQNTPLQEAVAAGDLPEVRSVLARGEDAEGRDIDGRTALINAGWRGDPNITETLLEVGADPDIVDHDGKSALIWAASNGNLAVTALLAEAGAELDTQDKQGLTALMRAAWNGHTKVVETLLTAGADTHLEDNNGLTALDHATREKYDDIVALLKGAAN